MGRFNTGASSEQVAAADRGSSKDPADEGTVD